MFTHTIQLTVCHRATNGNSRVPEQVGVVLFVAHNRNASINTPIRIEEKQAQVHVPVVVVEE